MKALNHMENQLTKSHKSLNFKTGYCKGPPPKKKTPQNIYIQTLILFELLKFFSRVTLIFIT